MSRTSGSDRQHELTDQALAPATSVVIEACAGSGKTWMLVSRIVRLLLAGAKPSEILAITFTRKAAQEMAARLRDWLYELAIRDDDDVRKFLRDRAVPEGEIETLLPRARLLYEQLLTAQPPITISTFHSWFLQLLRRAPLDAGAPGEVNLAEQTSALVDDAWELFASRLQRDPESAAARGLDRLFRDCGLFNTRRVLTDFLYRRADWLAYTQGEKDPVGYALARIREEMEAGPDEDVAGGLCADAAFCRELAEYARLLERNADRPEQENARFARNMRACEAATSEERFGTACAAILTKEGEPRKDRDSKVAEKRLGRADKARFLELHAKLGAQLQDACRKRTDQASYRFNEAALHCGAALLEGYQRVKRERQVIDYADIEWNAWRLMSVSDHAVYMHYKLDARYRHILLDEFQDTNPLQWLTLKSWLEAAAAADARPSVFMVGDPKQSIYRFRGAEARLFARASVYLEEAYGSRKLPQDETRRCPKPVIDVVNRLFGAEPAFQGFQEHIAHYTGKPGRVEVLPLVPGDAPGEEVAGALALRNPLESPLADPEDRRREREAEMLVERIGAIHGKWRVATDLKGEDTHPADYRDIMILVRRRTHLAIYERALRLKEIPFVTSRQGGLLDTLEARDIVALLEFLVSPFVDLKLAHALRSPVFGCSDEDLMTLAAAGEGKGNEENEGTWWERLQRIAEQDASPALQRARALLERWLKHTDSAPVHDQLDRIYFEADVISRYRQAAPEAMRGTVHANLQAFMQRALDTDSGRYPSLPRFLHELMDMREAPAEEAPDEGIVGDAGNAVRIYTVHGAKGLEAPIVWLLDAAAGQDAGRGYEALIDWPPEAESPRRFSLSTTKDEQSTAQQRIVDDEEQLAERENLNLLYVAMTRAQQALIVSGSEGKGAAGSWYERVRAALLAVTGASDDAAAVAHGDDLFSLETAQKKGARAEPVSAGSVDSRLEAPLPTGERRGAPTGRGLTYGAHFHALMERLTDAAPPARAALQRALGLADREFAPMWEQAQRVITSPALARFFDSRQFKRALNEVSYTTEAGEVFRIDRLVEIDDEMWVLDYKTGEGETADPLLMERYRAQVSGYREAIGRAYPGRRVNAAVVFTDGNVLTLDE